ncbi:hypothetical protein PENSPDRAFT_689804 [Peniophora sp. CONT]|nr:hypothetical protein PENSPDRAFT_689804 [Peniophora sp. CONT]
MARKLKLLPPNSESGTAKQDAAIYRLSEDVLALIFYELLWSRAPHQRCTSPPVLPLSHVCQLWRRASINNKRLWSYIPLFSPELATLFLKRSYPIDVSVFILSGYRENDDRYSSAITEVLSHPGRIRSLVNWAWGSSGMWTASTCTPDDLAPLSPLEVLGIYRTQVDHSTLAQLATCTHLRSLTLSAMHYIDFAKPIACAALTDLCLCSCSIGLSSFHILMISTPALQKLALFRTGFMIDGPTTNTRDVALPPILTDVYLVGSIWFIFGFLQKFSISNDTNINAHFVDVAELGFKPPHDAGPADPSISTAAWIAHQSARITRAEDLMHSMDHESAGFNRLLSSFHSDVSLVISSHSDDSIELLFVSRVIDVLGLTSTHAPVSLSFYYPSIETMASITYNCLCDMQMPKSVLEFCLQSSLRMPVLESILLYLIHLCESQNPPAKRLEIRGSEARLHCETLNETIVLLSEVWPDLCIEKVEEPSTDEDDDESSSDTGEATTESGDSEDMQWEGKSLTSADDEGEVSGESDDEEDAHHAFVSHDMYAGEEEDERRFHVSSDDEEFDDNEDDDEDEEASSEVCFGDGGLLSRDEGQDTYTEDGSGEEMGQDEAEMADE